MTKAAFELHRPRPDTLGVSGVLSFDNAAAALDAINAALLEGTVSRLDLSQVERSDSAGLACVLAAQSVARKLGRPLSVEHMPEGMRALARVCEVEPLLG